LGERPAAAYQLADETFVQINDATYPFPYATLIVHDGDNIPLELVWMA
jgi:hypothetical protein